MKNEFDTILKKLKGKRILLALSNLISLIDTYYAGKLVDITEETITILAETNGRFRRKKDLMYLNRQAFAVLYALKYKEKG